MDPVKTRTGMDHTISCNTEYFELCDTSAKKQTSGLHTVLQGSWNRTFLLDSGKYRQPTERNSTALIFGIWRFEKCSGSVIQTNSTTPKMQVQGPPVACIPRTSDKHTQMLRKARRFQPSTVDCKTDSEQMLTKNVPYAGEVFLRYWMRCCTSPEG